MITAFTKSNREIVFNRVEKQVDNHDCVWCGKEITLTHFGGIFTYENKPRMIHNEPLCMVRFKNNRRIERAQHGRITQYTTGRRNIAVRVS